MSREYANKLNKMLMIRAKNRVEDFHKPTGITKLLERNQTKNTREDFDKTFKEHVADGIKNRNIRGLFRVPEINDTNHLIVDAKEEDQEDEGNNMNLPDNDVPSVPHNRAMMSYPMRKPDVRPDASEERNPILRSGENREPIKVNLPLIGAEGIDPIQGFDDPIFKYDTKPRSIHDYLKLAKNNEHKIFAVMNPLTHEPQFVLKSKGDVTKLYHKDGLSKFYKYYDRDVQQIAGKSIGVKGRIAGNLYGNWKHDKLDQIRLQEHPIKFNMRDLPNNIIVVDHKGNDDDDDNDPGAGAERMRDARDFVTKTGREYLKAEEDEEEEKEPRGDQEIKMHKYHNDDDDDDADNDQFYSPARSERSEVYKKEILNLREVNQKLQKEVEGMIKTYPELTLEFEQRNKILEDNLKLLEDENNYYRDIEETAKRDLDELKLEYDKKVAELEHKETNNRHLQEQIDDLKITYNQDIDRINRLYQGSKNEQSDEIQDLLKKHREETNQFKMKFQQLEQNNRDLRHKVDDGNYKIKNLEERLENLNKEKFKLERNLSEEIQRLKYELNEQRGSFSQIREQEINKLNESISLLNSQKQQIENQYNNLYNEYQTMMQNMNALSSDQSQYLENLRAKEKQQQEDRNVYQTNYNQIVAEKNNIQNEAANVINQKDQLIQQLTDEINQMKAQQQTIVAKPEEVKLEIKPEQPRIQAEKYMVHEPISQSTRSHGPVEQGGFIETQTYDNLGRLENIDYKYKLQTGSEYALKNFFINLLLPDRGQVQQFKLAFRNTYNQKSFNKPEDYTKFVEEELNRHFNNKTEYVVAAMKNIIDSESRVSASFKKSYEDKLKTIKK